MQMEIIEVSKNDVFRIKAIAELTWPETFKEILTNEQIRYMLDWMYSLEILTSQIENGHKFYILIDDGNDLGFIGIELNKDGSQTLYDTPIGFPIKYFIPLVGV